MTYNVNAPVNDRVVRVLVEMENEVREELDLDKNYCVIMNNFLAKGGDAFNFENALKVHKGIELDAGISKIIFLINLILFIY